MVGVPALSTWLLLSSLLSVPRVPEDQVGAAVASELPHHRRCLCYYHFSIFYVNVVAVAAGDVLFLAAFLAMEAILVKSLSTFMPPLLLSPSLLQPLWQFVLIVIAVAAVVQQLDLPFALSTLLSAVSSA
eukprot:scaffold2772_cov16-Prasinocladus_malaysianus.AAC.2